MKQFLLLVFCAFFGHGLAAFESATLNLPPSENELMDDSTFEADLELDWIDDQGSCTTVSVEGAMTAGCGGSTTGNTTAVAAGGTLPYSYLWSNGATSSSVNGLFPGTYTVSVTDAGGCPVASTTFSITPAEELTVSIEGATSTGCPGNTTTELTTAVPSGGVPPYTFLWSNGLTTQSIMGVQAGTYTVTVTDSDFCAGARTSGSAVNSTASSSVTITEQSCNTPPTAVCAEAFSVDADADDCSAMVGADDINNGSFDDGGVISTSTDITDLSIGENTVTLIVTDDAGASSTCTTVVTVNDVTPPTAACENITVELDENGEVSTSAAATEVTFTINLTADNSITGNRPGFDPAFFTGCLAGFSSRIFTIPITLTSDGEVKVNSTSTSGFAELYIIEGDYDPTDGCGGNPQELSSFNPIALSAGNYSILSVQIGGSLPSTIAISFPEDFDAVAPRGSLPDGASFAPAQAGLLGQASTDNCSIASITPAQIDFTCDNIGSNNVTVTVADAAGNEATCTSVVTVTDPTSACNTPPTALCADAFSVDADADDCSATITAADIDNGSSDPEDGTNVGLEIDITELTVGENTVTLTVIDQDIASSTCTTVVTVNDVTPPTPVCVDIDVELNMTGSGMLMNGSRSISLVVNESTPLFTSDVIGTFGTPGEIDFDCGAQGGTWNYAVFSFSVTTAGEYTFFPNSDTEGGDNSSIFLFEEFINPWNICQTIVGGFYSSNSSPVFVTLAAGDYLVAVPAFPTTDNDYRINVPYSGPAAFTIASSTESTANPTGTAFNEASSPLDGGSTDNCGGVTVTPAQTDFTCDNIGSNNVTVTVADAAGNEATCTSVVTVTDPTSACNTPPTALCAAAFSADADADDCSATITAADIDNGSSDPEDGTSVTLDIDVTDLTLGENTVTLTVTDQNDATATCTTVVTVNDVTAPTAACADVTIELDEFGQSELAMSETGIRLYADGVTTPSQGGPLFSINNEQCSLAPFEVGSARYFPVPITVTTAGTYTFSRFSEVAFFLTIFPNIYTEEFNVSDPCENLFFAFDFATPSVFLPAGDYIFVGSNPINFGEPLDDNGWLLPYTGPAELQPRGTIPAGVVFESADNPVDGGSTDNCGPVTVTPAQTAFTCDNLGDNNVTVTVTDAAGNQATCTSVVTVVDTTAPTLTCAPVTVQIEADGNFTQPVRENFVSTIGDNCSTGADLVLSGDVPDVSCSLAGQTLDVMLTATDASDNATSCTTSLTIEDNVPPTIVCRDTTVAINAEGMASIAPSDLIVSEGDNCSFFSTLISGQLTFDCDDAQTTDVTTGVFTFEDVATITDFSGNTASCTVIVTVIDTIAPQITCATDTAYLDADGIAFVESTIGLESFSDNCSAEDAAAAVSFSVDCSNVDSLYSFGQVVRDPAGNTASCTSTILVLDTISPLLTCQDFIAELDADGNATQPSVDDIVTSLSDNCSAEENITVAFTLPTLDCDSEATTTTLTATDESGNSLSCTVSLSVVDNVPPTIVCRDTTVAIDAEGMASIDISELIVSTDDNCSVASTVTNFDVQNYGCDDALSPGFGAFGIFNLENAITVTDGAGNTASCTVTIMVIDTIAPQITCSTDTTYLDADGIAFVESTIGLESFSDNCIPREAGAAMAFSVDCNNVDSLYSFQQVVLDRAGNAATCTSTVLVLDTISPVLTCQDFIVETDTAGNVPQPEVSDVVAMVSDNCTAEDAISFVTTLGEIDCASGTTTAMVTASDESGNSTSCMVTVTVEDRVPPTVMANDTTLYLDANGMASLSTGDFDYAVDDNCDLASVVDLFRIDAAAAGAGGGFVARSVDQAVFFDCTDEGEIVPVEIVAEDGAGNQGTGVTNVTILDTMRPALVCQDVTVFIDENGMASVTDTSAAIVSLSDNCTDSATITITLVAPVLSCDGMTGTATLTATDENDNVSSCVIGLEPVDTLAPTAVCQDITVELDENGMASIAAGGGTASAVTEVSGEIDPTDPTWNRPSNIGMNPDACTPSGSSGTNASYETFSFTIDAADMYTFSMPSIAGPDFFFALYEGGFDATLPCANLLATDDDANGTEPELMIQLDLVPGDYTLVTTTFGNDSNAGAYTYTISSDNGGNVLASGGGSATSAIDGGSTDNCVSEGLTFIESVTEFTCDDLGENMVQLIVTDASGLSDTCTAIVTVEDNIAPVVTVTVDPLMINFTDAEPEMTVDFPAFVTATDNCDDELDFEADRDLTFTGTDIGSGSFTVTVTDDSGNPTTVTINFVVTFDQPNLACIGDINLTLNDECQGLLIPSMVLTGNTALNEFFDFDIVVQDSDPSNGPIIDGCGEFVYMISQRSDVAGPATLGFTGAYAPDQWFSAPFGAGDLFNNNTDEQIVTIDHTATTLEMTTFATVFSTGSQFGAQSSIQFGEMATVSFDYDFNGVDAFFDQAFSLTTFEGEVVDIGFNTITEEGGNVSFDVQPGYALIIQLRDDGFQPFAGPAPSVLTITGFEVAPMAADNPLDLDFESCWGIVRAEDKTPPAVVNQIAPIDLLCVDLDDNQVNTLPNNVDRCYEVFSATGATVPGTMATALRNALSAEVGNSAAIVPTFTDGCTERLEVCVTESIAFDAEDPQCNDVVLTRTFTATEIAVCPSASGESNGSTVSSYVITFSRPSLDDLDADNIEEVANYDECGVTTGTIAEIMASYPAPRATDFPFLVVGDRSFPLMDGEAVCNIGVTFADGQPIITCPNTYKFVRTYTVIDWCDPSDVRTFTQVVKVGDTEAPTFSGPTQDRDFDGVVDGDLIFSTNAGNQCAAYIVLDGPGVSATDNCEGAITITAQIYPGGDLTASPIGPFVVDLTDGNAEVTSPIPVGTHLLRYTYEDVCGNADFSDFEFTVEDGTAPVAICEDGLNISITSGQTQGGGASTGIAILTPEMIDAGSYDDCSGITLEIARVNGNNVATEAYDQELILTCADLGTVRVGLKVTDAEGNMNFCWLDVLVEDKNAPTCLPPGPVALTCVEYLAAGLPADINEASEDELNALFGSAVGIDNCEVTISSMVSGGVNSCGVGSLTRTFVATDGAGFVNSGTCEQFIDIRGVFDYRITFPTDEVFDECVDPDFNQLGSEEFACDLITTNVTMDTIAAVNAPDACYTLRVNYDVINFCEYNQLGECYRIPRDGDGIRNPDTQLLYLNVIPNNTANTGDDIAFLSRFTDRNYNPGAPQRDQLVDDGDDNDGSDDDNSNDSEEQQAANGVGFAYAQDNSRGYFCYVQFVDVYDEVAPTIEGDEPEECFAGTSADCTAEVELTFTADDNCTTPVVTVELDADYNVNAGFIPVNPASAGVSVSVSNDGINYTVNASNVPVGNHAIRIRANDGCGNFDSEIIEFCVEGDKAPTPICIQTLTVTLMPDGNGGGMAEIWASDFIASDVEDCFGNVIDKYSIYTEEEAGAAGFEPQVGDLGLDFTCDDYNGLGEDNTVAIRVYAIADNGSADYCSVVVDVQAFQEGVCGGGGDGGNLAGTILTQDDAPIVNVEVSLSDDSDMDMMVMTAANGTYTFGDLPQNVDYTVQPTYNVGVNLSNVTVADVNLMGNVILGIDQFATAYDYLAADTDRDRALTVGDMVTTQRIILGLEDNFAISNWGFVPADVDVSDPYSEAFPEVFNANDLIGTVVADFVGYELGNVNAANRASASIEVEDAKLEAGQTHTMVISGAELAGFQGTLELAAGLELLDVTYEGEGGLNLNGAANGVVTMMFLADATVNVEVRATDAGNLSDMVSLTSGVTVAEGINLNGTAGPLSLEFTGATGVELVNGLEQNAPNPASDVTRIGFTLAQAGEVTLTIQDVAGRTVSVRELTGVAGRNVVELNVADLGGATGVLSYTLVAGDFSATKKMIVVR